MVRLTSNQSAKKGAVSIFVMLFTTILLGIISLGFVRQMLLDQQRAIHSDLANSAYDSALAGVTDAKRAIINYEKKICGDVNNPNKCDELLTRALNGKNCDAVQEILGGNLNQEVKIQTSSGVGGDLEQAYTCARIKYFTDDYVRDFNNGAGEQIVVPLNFSQYTDSLLMQWHTDADIKSNDGYNLTSYNIDSWPQASGWGKQPPVLMVQYIRKGQSEAPTLFLKPVAYGGNSSANFSEDLTTPIPNKRPPIIEVNCNNSGGYKCQIDLTGLSTPRNSRSDFLRIAKIYDNATTIRFKPQGTNTKFNGIQPEIDVTGRANHVFRRLKARIEFTNGLFPYPSAALNVDGGLHKSFEITDFKLKGGTSFAPDKNDPDVCDNLSSGQQSNQEECGSID